MPSLPDRARRSAPLFFGALLSGGALYLASTRLETLKGRIEAGNSPTDVVVAAGAIAAGEPFREENLARRSIPSSAVGKRHVPAADFHLLVGGRAREAVSPGEPILWSDVADPAETSLSEAVPAGRRGVTLPVEGTSTFGGMLRPGDTVDLLCSDSAEGLPPVLLERVPVLAVGRELLGAIPGEGEGGDGTASTATLSLLPRESALLLGAARRGTVQWMLRNGTDNGVRPPHLQAGRKDAVELLEGGLPCARRSAS